MRTPRMDQVEWLSVISYQLAQARSQAGAPPPLNTIAINALQDAIESLLRLALQFLPDGPSIPGKASFPDLLKGVVAAADPSFGLIRYVHGLETMNTARVGFKHHNTGLSESTIRRMLNEGEEFADLVSVELVGIPLANASLLTFVRSELAREHLRSAQESDRAGQEQAAQLALRLAFDEMLHDYRRRRDHSVASRSRLRPNFLPPDREFLRAGAAVIALKEWLGLIETAMELSALGLDMNRYAYFLAHTPHVTYSLDRTPHYDNLGPAEGATPLDRYAICRKFVLDTALDLGATTSADGLRT